MVESSTNAVVAGIDLGGTKTTVVLCRRDGSIAAQATIATPAREGGAAMSAAASGLVKEMESSSGLHALAVGVGAAGVIDQKAGVVTAASASFKDWAGFRLAADLSARVGVGVVIDNDVNAFLRGEMAYGALIGCTDAVGIMLGTGVGGALALNGSVFAGPRGAAGEIGHTPGFGALPCSCGQQGHLETLASGRSIALRYTERSGRAANGAAQVADFARAGDPHALATFDAAGRALGQAIVTTATILDVQDVVVGGGVRGAWDLIEPPLAKMLEHNMPVSGYPLIVHPGSLGGSSAVLGSAAAAWESLAHSPELANTMKVGSSC
ncbi:glucokinase [Arthrobacter alpinus]|uniref:Glucokinase n=1 Tax=Arthrobacter alpinus TaxID=656366 RepID=A0A1H5F2L5_9MICC|nr:ROK family protein [Arthrobacter alpinus]SED97687.1 glucokinase [Arthrobacter alpinus]